MNILKETIQFMGSYYDSGLFTIDLDELVDFINQNYISKEEILGLECLKEEKHDKDCLYNIANKYSCDCGADDTNEKIDQIKEDITNLSNKEK